MSKSGSSPSPHGRGRASPVADETPRAEARGPAAGFAWPSVGGETPVWTGAGFQIGAQRLAVLDYDAGASGWSAALTRFHEEAAAEGTHPIDVASRQRARRSLTRHLRTRQQAAVILEVGCSTGYLLKELADDWPTSLVIGSDFIADPLRRLAGQMPEMPLLRFDMVECPLPSASVDAVVLLNVLEHIEDDGAAISQVARILTPGGIAVVEVPAGPGLYDVYDKYLKHYRRYCLAGLCQLLEREGLAVVERSHLGVLLYPAFAVVKRRNRSRLKMPEDDQRRVVQNRITATEQSLLVRGAFALETLGSRWFSYPIGIRCVAVAVKPSSAVLP